MIYFKDASDLDQLEPELIMITVWTDHYHFPKTVLIVVLSNARTVSHEMGYFECDCPDTPLPMLEISQVWPNRVWCDILVSECSK